MFFMEFYFARYREEELGWNTAFGNTLVLIFVTIDLAKHVYYKTQLTVTPETAIVIAILFLGILMTSVDYWHLLPKKIAYDVSSKLPINFIAYAAIILVYTDRSYIPLDYITGIAFLFILVVLAILVGMIHLITPKAQTVKIPEAP